MWLRTKYPVEYICALLTYGSNDEDRKNEYIDEAFRLGLDLRPPKIGVSLSREWKIFNGRLYAPFIEIKGVGDKTANAFLRVNKEGFFQKEGKERAVSSKFMKILDDISAYEDCRISNEEAEDISGFLGINFVNKYKNVKKRRKDW
jgi:DNA polymerase III alpha subunit